MPNFIELGIYFLFGTKSFGNEGIGCNFDFLGGYVVVIATDLLITTGQIVHHNPCFNLFILHNIPFDNQGSEINKNDIFLGFDILSFTKTLIYLICIYIYIYIKL